MGGGGGVWSAVGVCGICQHPFLGLGGSMFARLGLIGRQLPSTRAGNELWNEPQACLGVGKARAAGSYAILWPRGAQEGLADMARLAPKSSAQDKALEDAGRALQTIHKADFSTCEPLVLRAAGGRGDLGAAAARIRPLLPDRGRLQRQLRSRCRRRLSRRRRLGGGGGFLGLRSADHSHHTCAPVGGGAVAGLPQVSSVLVGK